MNTRPKITFNENSEIAFSELRSGSTFKMAINFRSDIWIKTNEDSCVLLNDGSMGSLRRSDLVIPIKCEIVVGNTEGVV